MFGGVEVRYSDGRAGFAGLQSCGSVWACPMCAVKVGSVRALEIGLVVTSAIAQGFDVGFVTLTLRHDRGQRLTPLWDALAGCWHAATNRKGWDLDVERFGVEGWVRVHETTWGVRNGWHPHVHALIVARSGFDVEALGASMHRRWVSAALRAGLDAPLIEASDFQIVRGSDASDVSSKLGEYLAGGFDKVAAIGRELVGSSGKTARYRHSTITPWQVLHQFLDEGETRMLNVWHEWERASKGRRQLGWSKGMRARFGVAPERSDEEIAADELGTRDDTVCTITPAGWKSLLQRTYLIPRVLETLEAGGWVALREWLVEHEVEHHAVVVGSCSSDDVGMSGGLVPSAPVARIRTLLEGRPR